jgi:pimeloyl-ACP methyl ester carboxylesterase
VLVQSTVPKTPGLQFTEFLKGWFSTDVPDGEYEVGATRGRTEGSLLEAEVTVTFDDLEELLRQPASPGRLDGEVLAPKLSPFPLTVTGGEFRLFEPDRRHVETWNMRYSMALTSDEGGRRYRLEGVKVLHDDPGFDIWKDTTRLYVRILDHDGTSLGAGVLCVSLADLIRNLRTVRVLREPSPAKRTAYVGRFLRLWASRLLHTYAGLDEKDGRFWGNPRAKKKPVEPTPDRRADLIAWCDGREQWHDDGTPPGDDAWLQLTRFNGGSKGPVMLASGFAMAARSFALTMNKKNLVACLLEKDFDVWLFDTRSSIELESARTEFTLDDIARKDWPVAVREVLRRTQGDNGVQVVGHCAGSVTFLMAMLAGLDGVRAAVCSQYTMYPQTSSFIKAKVRIPVPQLLQMLGFKTLSPNYGQTWKNKLIDTALAVVPIPRQERCGSALCRWVNLIYGMTHRHAQLNDATHRALVEAFGVGNLDTIKQLGLIMRRGIAVDHSGNNSYVEFPDRLAIPIHFLVGEHNYMFFPATTDTTLRWLGEHNDPSLYTYTELPGYAHLDCFIGRNAADEVFPGIIDFLDAN